MEEKQPHLEEVLASPLFSLGQVIPIFFPLRNVLVSWKRVGIAVLPPTRKGNDTSCVTKKAVHWRTVKREQSFDTDGFLQRGRAVAVLRPPAWWGLVLRTLGGACGDGSGRVRQWLACRLCPLRPSLLWLRRLGTKRWTAQGQAASKQGCQSERVCLSLQKGVCV